jgi:predicted Fe-S protein YdhL (DUF1289 family)
MSRRRRQLWRSLQRLESVPGGGLAGGEEVASPCTGACRLDEDGLCADCHRTLAEIAEWTSLSAEGKRDVVAAAAWRAAASG